MWNITMVGLAGHVPCFLLPPCLADQTAWFFCSHLPPRGGCEKALCGLPPWPGSLV